MSNRARRILTIVLLAIPVIVFAVGGFMKITGAEPEMVMQFLTKSGFGDYITVLGIAELAIAALLVYPKTNKIGFLLATGYFGGAFCLEISGSQPKASVFFLAILWVGMFLKRREIFLDAD